ncbi:DNA-binding NarL/FixJ family response regulator [Rhodococcus sp. 27YEA15]|uniref:helix-turn-helix domain-containing protein n=1 Tax=Rhodococcus sp. 27YEA15 TaxID=3156259 RepID=UPI003C7B4050
MPTASRADLLRELTHSEAEVVSDVAEILGEGLPVETTADAMFDALERLVPYAGLSLSVPRPVVGQHRTIASRGYDQSLLEFLDRSYLREDPGYQWMLKSGSRHFNWLAPDFDYASSNSARIWFRPAGFSGGSTNHLQVRSRYVGELHISTEDPRWPTPRALSVIDLMGPLISGMVNDFTLPQRLLDEQPPGTCAVVMVAGGIEVIPGRAACDLLERASDLLESVRRQLPPHSSMAALDARWHWQDPAGEWHYVFAVPVVDGWMVMHRRDALPYAVTARELDVLTLLATGATNHWIGSRLGISTKTVVRHVENSMGKLGVTNRVALANTARELGLSGLDRIDKTGRETSIVL